jgi:hypothetical protein
MSSCDCLRLFAQDPRLPVDFDPSTGRYSLNLAQDLRVAIQHCPCCHPGAAEVAHPCTCRHWDGWVNRPDVPIELDREMNEVNLRCSDGASLIIYYCPVCGGEMPKSTRGAKFMEPSAHEVRAVWRLTGARHPASRLARLLAWLLWPRPLRTIEEVLRRLGPPDRRVNPPSPNPIDRSLYSHVDVKTQLVYSSIWRTLDLVVFEGRDGSISFSWHGKHIPSEPALHTSPNL